MKLVHHGAYDGVTGSCHELFMDSKRSLLVDCGIFQGNDAKKHPNPEIEFPIGSIEAMLLTHVHVDHVGRLPYLIAAGFDKPIYCSHPTARLMPLVMEDSLKIGFTRSRHLIQKFLKQVQRLLRPIDYHVWETIGSGWKIRLNPAGHVLGSCMFDVELPDQKRVVFSGDVGTGTDPLLRKPASPERADLLVLESTYGDRLHPSREDRGATLERVLRRTLDDKGVTIIPAFSLGRTQALLFEMNQIFERLQASDGQSLLHRVDVIVDSPLASRYTEIYKEMKPYWGEEAQTVLETDDQPLVFENLTTVGNHREHRDTLDYVSDRKIPAIVIAGSGMCTGGRVVNYLKRFLNDETTDLVFVGYQAGGTPGNFLSRGSEWVRLDGRRYEVAAKVHSITGYSAHGDQADLIELVENMSEKPGEIRLVHGDYQPKQTLAEKLRQLGHTVS
ncbi:MBL fold metallo-hydrolase [Rubripirellula amarantea]|uniref:Ribonuclease n=1 Tax=Rubripirellula amarantea TaxID=2527999 RepID=A0A5C5WRC3_9BACT|nr:MBL fold metallo-hydrolase [Rubripirellula amarantea]MDA8746270.1 MBL fold metallo-hydrolase [Rubripirellula amarantea]TWT53366.1 Ribonuclease [Rubripirellula amarantea]